MRPHQPRQRRPERAKGVHFTPAQPRACKLEPRFRAGAQRVVFDDERDAHRAPAQNSPVPQKPAEQFFLSFSRVPAAARHHKRESQGVARPQPLLIDRHHDIGATRSDIAPTTTSGQNVPSIRSMASVPRCLDPRQRTTGRGDLELAHGLVDQLVKIGELFLGEFHLDGAEAERDVPARALAACHSMTFVVIAVPVPAAHSEEGDAR